MSKKATGPAAPSAGRRVAKLPSTTEAGSHDLRYTMPAAFLFAVHVGTPPHNSISFEAVALYMEQLMADLGSPTDRLEQMLIQQIAIAHHNLGRLHIRGASATTATDIERHSEATVQQSAEFRQLIQVLINYRAGIDLPTHLTQILQQNVAQNQQVEFVGEQ